MFSGLAADGGLFVPEEWPIIEIDQIDPEYSRNVDSWIEPGNNYVEIKPKSDIHIVELKVELE